MHIAIVRRYFTLKKGGAENYAVLIAREFLRRGWRVSVVAEQADVEGLSGDLSIHLARTVRFKTFVRHLLFLRTARRILNSIRPDRVLALSRFDRADIYRSGDPLFLHWLNRHKPNLADRLLGWLNPKQRFMLQLESRVFNSSAVKLILALSHMDARLMRQYYGVPRRKIVVLHNGYDPTRFNPDVKRHRKEVRRELGIGEKPLLLFVGMDFKRKGLALVLASLVRLKDAVLVVVGGGERDRFVRIAERMGVGERVVFVGRREDVERFYGAADLLVLPSRYDPFCNVVLEAMACAVPVVVTENMGAAELVSPSCGVVLPSSPEPDEIVEAVEHILTRGEQFGESAHKAVKHLTIKKYVDEVVALLQSLD